MDSRTDPGGLSGFAVDVVESTGELGVGVLIALENVVPPVPSEVILPFAGFAASRGELDLLLTWVAATAGALVGAYVLYAVGAVVGEERAHRLARKRWFVLFSPGDLARGQRAFARHGGKVVLLGRCVPFVRSVVSVPAGLARMPLPRFTLLTLVGSGAWNALFLLLGYQLAERWQRVERYSAPVSATVVLAVALAVVWLAVRRRRSAVAGRA